MTRINLKQPPEQIIAECDALIFDQAAEIRALDARMNANPKASNPRFYRRLHQDQQRVAEKMFRVIEVKRVAEGVLIAESALFRAAIERDPWKST